MPSWRLSSNGPGPDDRRASVKIAAALLPVPAHDAGAWQSRGQVSGSPGTARIPAPPPNVPANNRVAQAQTGWIGLPSSDFSYWRPAVYYTWPASRVKVSVFSDNQMPVPAVNPAGHPVVAMPGPVMLNHFQVPNPRVASRFPPLSKRPRKPRRVWVDR